MIKINLDDTGANVDIEDNGVKTQKYLSINSLRNCLLSDYKVDSGVLPNGTVGFSRDRNEIKIAMVSVGGIVSVKYDINTEKDNILEYKIPIPPTMWIFKLNIKNVVKDVYLYALKSTQILPDTMLYHAPFANVYNDSKICWGDRTFLNNQIKILVGLSSFPDIFFSRPFNYDLEPNFMDGCRNYFNSYNGKTEFPFDFLKEKNTFKEIWNGN